MADRSETAIVFLVLAAAASVLAAPVLGRLGAVALANGAMGLAAVCGCAAFGLAAQATLRASRRSAANDPDEPRA